MKLTQYEIDNQIINESRLISRDLSWLSFNDRVLEQSTRDYRSVTEKLKFLAITASNLDEFFMIRVGSLYNYLDYGKSRKDFSGLKNDRFKDRFFFELHKHYKSQYRQLLLLREEIKKINQFGFLSWKDLTDNEIRKAKNHFSKIIYPMLTPMVFDTLHTFPVLMNKVLIFAVSTVDPKDSDQEKVSFIQIPQNLARYFVIERDGKPFYLPIEEIIENNLSRLFQNIEIKESSLFRITRNGDFDWDDFEEEDEDFIEEVQDKLKRRKTGRVVRLECINPLPKSLSKLLRKRFKIKRENIFETGDLLDLTSLWQIIGDKANSDLLAKLPKPIASNFVDTKKIEANGVMNYLNDSDIFLHHPYHSFEYVIRLLEEAAEDPNVLSIKITIYRLAKNSRVANALHKAAENGKHVTVLFEVKARFDEENNLIQGQRLQKAGCYIVYGVAQVKTHTKLLLIVRKVGKKVTRYLHMSSGNYNETTARLYSDTSYLTIIAAYGRDVTEFFNVVTGHSIPKRYEKLITTPGDMRKRLIRLINAEIKNAKTGKKSGIILKVNSLQDNLLIEALYRASNAGVPIKLIVSGICCIRPGRKGLSENIKVKSIVGDFLEHSRLFYFHNDGKPKLYGGSADIMVRSFDRRIESLFLMEGEALKAGILILKFNLQDEVNTFDMNEDGSFTPIKSRKRSPFNIFKEFYKVQDKQLEKINLF